MGQPEIGAIGIFGILRVNEKDLYVVRSLSVTRSLYDGHITPSFAPRLLTRSEPIEGSSIIFANFDPETKPGSKTPFLERDKKVGTQIALNKDVQLQKIVGEWEGALAPFYHPVGWALVLKDTMTAEDLAHFGIKPEDIHEPHSLLNAAKSLIGRGVRPKPIIGEVQITDETFYSNFRETYLPRERGGRLRL